VLLASTRIARRDLEMPLRDRTDPDVAPRRRNHERAKSMNSLPLADYAAVRIDVRESSTDATPANARQRVRHIAKPSRFRGTDEFARRPLTQCLPREG